MTSETIDALPHHAIQGFRASPYGFGEVETHAVARLAQGSDEGFGLLVKKSRCFS